MKEKNSQEIVKDEELEIRWKNLPKNERIHYSLPLKFGPSKVSILLTPLVAKRFIEYVIGEKPLMSENEKQYIENRVRDKVVLEWGAGGSTLYFGRLAKRYYSIEPDIQWYLGVQNSIKNDKELRGKVFLNYMPEHLMYIYYIHWLPEKRYDAMILDAQSSLRVPCLVNAIPFIDNKTDILFLDFIKMPHFKPEVLKYFDVIEMVDDLAILKLRGGVNEPS